MSENLCLLNTDQVCEKLNLSKSTLYRNIRDGFFPAGKKLLGDKRVWLSKDIDAWLIKAMSESKDVDVEGGAV